MFWDQDIETLGVEPLREFQLEKFNASIQQAKKSGYYREKLRGFDKLEKLDDIEGLPFTCKQDLRDGFPYGFLCVDISEAVRLHSSSGTTGNPTVIFHTSSDIEGWSDFAARSMYMAGVRKEDVFQNIMGYGLFTGGLGFHYGAERLGVLTIPSGPGNSRRQVWFMQKFGTTVIHILPNYALRLHSFFRDAGMDPVTDLRLRIAFVGAEPHSEEVRKKIENLYSIKVYNSYGLSEMYGPGVAFECPLQDGMHIWEDYFYPEIIDPATGRPLPEGEEGELVLSTLRRRAMPILRYRTRDLTRILPGKCECGRTHRRIERIKGRTDDMLIINGVNIFPVQIEKTVMKVPEAGSSYLIEVGTQGHMDKLTVKVELAAESFHGTLRELENLQKHIADELRDEIGVYPEVQLVESGSLPVSEGKAERVIDLREEK